MTHLSRLLLASCLGLAALESPRAQTVDGTWIAEYDAKVRSDDSRGTTVEKGRARLVLTRRGDSVSGVWEAIAADGRPSAPRQLRGTIARDTVRLSAQVQMRLSSNGTESVRPATVEYRFVLAGDALRGTIATVMEGTTAPPRQFTARREGAP